MAVAAKKAAIVGGAKKVTSKKATNAAKATKGAVPKAPKAAHATKGTKAASATAAKGPRSAKALGYTSAKISPAPHSAKPAPAQKGPRPVSHNDVVRIRKSLGVSREVFSRMTGFSLRAIAGWEGGRVVSASGVRRLKEMDRLRVALAEIMKPDFIPHWLTSPCEALGNLKPVEVLERGEIDRLWRTVLFIGSGMPI